MLPLRTLFETQNAKSARPEPARRRRAAFRPPRRRHSGLRMHRVDQLARRHARPPPPGRDRPPGHLRPQPGWPPTPATTPGPVHDRTWRATTGKHAGQRISTRARNALNIMQSRTSRLLQRVISEVIPDACRSKLFAACVPSVTPPVTVRDGSAFGSPLCSAALLAARSCSPQLRLACVHGVAGGGGVAVITLTSEGSVVRTRLRPPGGLHHVSPVSMFTFGSDILSCRACGNCRAWDDLVREAGVLHLFRWTQMPGPPQSKTEPGPLGPCSPGSFCAVGRDLAGLQL